MYVAIDDVLSDFTRLSKLIACQRKYLNHIVGMGGVICIQIQHWHTHSHTGFEPVNLDKLNLLQQNECWLQKFLAKAQKNRQR